jgi:hypothetical protein
MGDTASHDVIVEGGINGIYRVGIVGGIDG